MFSLDATKVLYFTFLLKRRNFLLTQIWFMYCKDLQKNLKQKHIVYMSITFSFDNL